MLPLRLKLTALLTCGFLLLTACQAIPPAAEPLPSPSSTPELAPTRAVPTKTAPSLSVEQTPSVIPQISNYASLDEDLSDEIDWFILIKDADSGENLFERNPEAAFTPASMIKIPTAMAVMSILEDQGRSLEDLNNVGIGDRNFTKLLEAMVVHSEESATDMLEYFARGENRLRKKLDAWGLTDTRYDPRVSTATDLITALELLHQGKALNPENTAFLLDLMGAYTENDHILLGKLNKELPECVFLNKRGTLLNPTIAADMGILTCGERSWYLVVAGTPAAESKATFEDIQAFIESFALAFARLVKPSLR